MIGWTAMLAVLFSGERPPALWYPFVVPSIGWVRADPAGVGTGWLAADRVLVTCRHVVGDRQAVEVFFPLIQGQLLTDRTDYVGRRDELRRAGLLVSGRVRRTEDRSDLAVIELTASPPGRRPLVLARSLPQPGDAVWSIGNRHDLETLWNVSSGPVRQTGRLADGYFWQGTRLAVGAGAMLLQLPIAEGDSGGPVLDAHGRVAAVVSAVRPLASLGTVGIAADEVRKLLGEGTSAESVLRRPASVYSTLAPATVWIRPTATSSRTAGVLIDRDRRLVLTTATGAGEVTRVGVVFPLPTDFGRWLGDRDAYADPVGLHQRGAWRTGTVIARDPRRDLALVRLDSVPPWARAVPLAASEPIAGESVHTVGHPMGTEFVWVYAAGVVRQRGQVALGPDETRCQALVLQLPSGGNSSGGPVANARGQLVGVLAAKSGPRQQVAYAAALAEVRAFLAEPPAARLPALDRSAIHRRADEWLQANEPKKAAGELDRLLEVDPADVETRLRLANAWARALDDAKATRGFAYVLRINPKEFPRVAADVGRHADELHRKNPGEAETWLRTAVPALIAALPPGPDRDRLTAENKDRNYPALRAALNLDARKK
jgi:S1-C subfamily serine protease